MSWESKAISGALVDRDADNALEEVKRAWPDSVRLRTIRQNIALARARYVEEIDRLVQLPGAEPVRSARVLMLATFEAAMVAGGALAGLRRTLTEREIVNLGRMVEAEVDAFARFQRSIAAEARQHRSRLYGGAVDAAFWRGWVAALPPTAIIRWRLGVADHCQRCPELALGGPYSKPGHGRKPLPTVPKNGDTQCLANCQCHLVATGTDFVSRLLSSPSVEVLAIGATELATNSDASIAAGAMYNEVMQSYTYALRMDVVEPNRGHDVRAASLRRQIDAMARNANHRIRMALTPAEIQEPVLTAQSFGMRFVPPRQITDDLIGLIAVVLYLDDVQRGKIQAVSGSRIQLEKVGWVTIGDSAGTLLFVEDASR